MSVFVKPHKISFKPRGSNLYTLTTIAVHFMVPKYGTKNGLGRGGFEVGWIYLK